MVWPLATHAQQSAAPVIGFLDGQTPDTRLMMAFRQALKDAGFVEGRNVAIDYRSASGHTDRLLTLAGDLVDRRVAVIVATGGTAAANAAYAATTTIPIVFASSVDPVASGLVNSLNRPDGNATGVYVFQQVLEGKRLGLLRELVPAAALIAVLLNPTNANFQAQLGGVQEAARAAGQRLSISRSEASSTSRLRSRPRLGHAREHCWSVLTRSLTAGSIKSLRWRRVTPFRQFMRDVILSWPVVWRAMARASPTLIARLACTQAVFSRERSPPTCRSCSRPNSSL